MDTRRTYVATACGVSVLLILMVGFSAFDPRSQLPALAQVARFIALVLLVAGIIPGSFLAQWIAETSRKKVVRQSRLWPILGVGAPLVFIAASAVAIANDYATLKLLENTHLTTIDRSWVHFNLVRYWTIGLASLGWLVVEIAIVLGRRPGSQQD